MVGVNLVGHLRAELGIGEVARQLVRAFDAAGVPVHPVDLPAGASANTHPFEHPGSPDGPFGTTVMCLNAPQAPLVRERLGPELVDGRHRIGVWWWEAPVFPADLQPAFDYVDEVWAGSRFIADTIRAAAPERVTVTHVPMPVTLDGADAPPRTARADLGLPDGFLVLFVFDHNSVLARKNPLGLIDAYTRAFTPADGAALVVKSINGDRHPQAHAQLVAAAAARDDVHVIDRHLDAAERDAWLAACDCYASLHRAEGFGMTMAEAMLLGRPVVATGWSGNVDFMPAGTAFLVDHTLVPIGPDAAPYPPEAEWAEPDLDHAAALLRAVRDDPEQARAVAERGRAHIAADHAPAAVGRALAERLVPSTAMPSRSNAPSAVKRAARKVTWPVRRLVDSRFADTNRRVEYAQSLLHEAEETTRKTIPHDVDHIVRTHLAALESQLVSRIDTHEMSQRDTLALIGSELRDLGDAVDELGFERLERTGAAGLTPAVARFLNFAAGHRGFAAESDLWFNPPISVVHREGGVDVGTTNERIVEVPFAFRALRGLPDGGRVLDVGCMESTLPVSLASLGYAVTALDLREYPLRHPNLEVVQSRLEEWEPPQPFDAIVLLSTVEHVGLGWYGEQEGETDGDRAALERLGGWLAPEGRLVLTVPYAQTHEVTAKERIYDAASLDALLAGWHVDERVIVRRADERTWVQDDGPLDDGAVALVVARRPETP